MCDAQCVTLFLLHTSFSYTVRERCKAHIDTFYADSAFGWGCVPDECWQVG